MFKVWVENYLEFEPATPGKCLTEEKERDVERRKEQLFAFASFRASSKKTQQTRKEKKSRSLNLNSSCESRVFQLKSVM